MCPEQGPGAGVRSRKCRKSRKMRITVLISRKEVFTFSPSLYNSAFCSGFLCVNTAVPGRLEVYFLTKSSRKTPRNSEGIPTPGRLEATLKLYTTLYTSQGTLRGVHLPIYASQVPFVGRSASQYHACRSVRCAHSPGVYTHQCVKCALLAEGLRSRGSLSSLPGKRE